MNNLMVFEDKKVEIIERNGEPLFEIYSTGMALGYSRWDGKSFSEQGVQKLFPYKSRIDKVLKSAEIEPCIHDVHSYLTESQLYDFMLEAKTEKCKPFRKWVTSEVLPSIRKNGLYTANQNLISEIKGQIATQINDILEDKIAEAKKYYRIQSKTKSDISSYIKKRLGILRADDEYGQVKARVFLILGINKWEDLDIDSYRNILPIIDESIRVVKFDRPQQIEFWD